MGVTSLRLYERAMRQFIGTYQKLYLKLGRYHKWKLIKLIEFVHSTLDVLYDKNPVLASKIRKCGAMKQMEKALKGERIKYNQSQLKRANQISQLVLQKRENQNGQINGGALQIINYYKRGSQTELLTQKTPLMLPDLRKNKSQATKQLSASEIQLLANFAPKRNQSNLERLKRGRSHEVVSQFLGFEQDHNKYYAWKKSVNELWIKKWKSVAMQEEHSFILGLEPSQKPVWFRGTIFFAILKLRAALVNFSTPFPPLEISRMILDTFIELHRLKGSMRKNQFSQINQMFTYLRLINMPFALLNFHHSALIQQLIFKLIEFANEILNYEEITIQEAYHEHFKRGNDRVFSSFADLLMDRMIQIRHMLLNGNIKNSDVKSQIHQSLKSSFVSKSRVSTISKSIIVQQNNNITDSYELQPQNKDGVIREVLRFLELLNQNHFEKMQIMMDDLQGHNFISLTVFFLEKQIELVSELDSPMAINTAIQALKTLAQFTQGPCQKNQRQMLEIGFLEIAKDILKIQILSDINSQLYTPKEVLQISFLKQKLKYYVSHNYSQCLVTMKSLMEGDMEDMVVKLIVQVIPLNLLESNFTAVFIYMMQHFSTDQNDVYFNMDRATPQKQFIIQVGFLTFMIYRLCLEYRHKLYNAQDARKNVEVIRNEQSSSIILLFKEFIESCKKRHAHGCPCRIRNFQQNSFFQHQSTLQDTASILASEDSVTQQDNEDSNLSNRDDKIKRVKNCCCKKSKKKSNWICRCSRPDPPFAYSRNDIFSEKQVNSAVSFYRSNSERIQILKNGKLERFEFPKLPSSRFLSYDSREYFFDNLDRTSAKTKVESLVTQSQQLINEMENQYFFRHQFLYFRNLKIQAKYSEVHKNYAFYLTLILNLLILLSFTEDQISVGNHDLGVYDTWFIVIGVFHLFSMLMVFLFTVVKQVFVQCKNKTKAWYSLPSWFPRSLTNCQCCHYSLFFRIVINPTLFYYNGMMIITILALTYNHLFYSVLMIDIINRSTILRNVLRAIWHPRQQIIIIFIFLIVLVYVFSVMGYLWFARHFPVECGQFYNCLSILIDQTFREGLAIYLSDNLQHPAYQDNVLHGDLVVFEIIFHILIVILLIEILSGIIIDTFSKLREEADRRNQDESTNCFICGLNRDQIQRDYGHDFGFSVHTKGIHSPLNYLYFLGYLHGKQSSEYTGTESYVHELIKKQDNSWFPCYDTLIQQRVNLL